MDHHQWDQLITKFGGVVINHHETIDTFHICFADEIGEEFATVLSAMHELEYYERETRVRHSQVQDDPPNWGLDRLDSMNGYYQFNQTGKGINVYVIDTGVSSHDELAGRVHLGMSLFGDSDVGPWSDPVGHGTHVSGIIAGREVGVAKEANIISVKILQPTGETPMSDIINGALWVATNAIKPCVINLSISGTLSPTLENAMNAILARDIPVVVAAGNDMVDACSVSPSSLGADSGSSIIVAGAIDSSDKPASFSNYGSCVTMMAPGVSIYSTAPDNKYRVLSGTSMSAPFITGIVANLLEENPNLTAAQIKNLLLHYSVRGVGRSSNSFPNAIAQCLTAGPSGNLVTLDLYLPIWQIAVIIVCSIITAALIIYLALLYRKKITTSIAPEKFKVSSDNLETPQIHISPPSRAATPAYNYKLESRNK